MKTRPLPSFTVIYWCGGSEAGRWERCLPVATRDEAERLLAEVERAGRPGYVRDTHVLDVVGVPDDAPVWWDFSRLRRKAA
jgi:hypothetical protein